MPKNTKGKLTSKENLNQ